MSLAQSVRFASLASRLGHATHWTPARVQRLAMRRLRWLLRHTARHSAYYREKYRGIDVERESPQALPPITKDELRNNFQAVLTDPALRQHDIECFMADPANLGRWFLGRYALSHTSGSQGLPLTIVQDRRSLEVLFAAMSARANAGARPSLLEGLRRIRQPARIGVVAQHRGFYPSAAAFEFMREITRPFTEVRRFSALDADLAEQLNEFQPHSLVGYASVLESLALNADAFALRELRQIGNSSEQLTNRARSRIQAAFGVPVVDHYGIGECLFLSDGCPTDGGAHVNADWVILEVVDDQYRPVPDGQVGSKVLVTNLANHIQPIIRYEVPDRLVMATTACRCGSRLPRIERIDGRSPEAFWIIDSAGRNCVLPGVLFHNAIDELHTVREWRAIQVDRHRIELQLEFMGDAEPTCDERALVARLHAGGLPAHVRVEVESVVGLRPDPLTGKYRRLVSQIGPPPSILLDRCA